MPIAATFLITDLDRGGTPLLLAGLARGLRERGRILPEVVSIAPAGEIAGMLQEAGVRVYSLDARGNKDLGVVGRFSRHLQERRPDVVFSMLVHANLVAALARGMLADAGRIKWVQSLHTVQERPRWHWVVSGMIAPMADLFVAPSSAVLRKLEGFGAIPGGGIAIPNGIDVQRFANATPVLAAQRPWPAEAFVVGYLGRFDPVKRLPLLIEAAERLPRRADGRPVHVALVGYGEEEERLRTLVERRGLGRRVHFPGPTREPERWYKAFDLFCSPSSSEGFGLTLVEAVCAGVAVAACDVAAIRESVGPEAEILWMPGEPGAGDVVRAFEEAGGGGRGRGVRAAAGVEQYSEGRMVERYEAELVALAGRK